tara:strand:- start:244 stop:1209 length:966 start_codon:yes stop_codon:yes gene_type:complete
MTLEEYRSSGIPVIDIGPLRDGSNPVPVAKALHRASREVGFLYVTNHGISEQSINRIRDAAKTFFRHDEEDKNTVAVSGAHRGYLGLGGAVMQSGMPPDLKESFIWGYENADGLAPDDHSLRGRNKWPLFVPELRSIAMDYFKQVHAVAHRLMTGFALGLGLPGDAFLKTSDRPLSRASLVNYPPQSDVEQTGEFGVGPHTDFGVLTVLCQDMTGGLEVEALDGTWVPAPPIPNTLVVNVGDLLARWTNGKYRSTPHRVINSSGHERLSLVLAYDPEPQTMIDPRDILGQDCDPNQPPISCGDYLTWRFERAFSYRKPVTL